MSVALTVVPEPSHARSAAAPPDGAGARRAPAAPAPAAAARPGPLGAGRRAGAERLPGGGGRGTPAVGALPRATLPWAPYHALRQRLREWLLDGADKASPCATQVEVEACFAPLLRWVLGWWRGRD